MTNKTVRRAGLISSLALIILLCLTLQPIRNMIAHAGDTTAVEQVHYFNNDVNEDDDASKPETLKNNYNFGPDRHKKAQAAVKNGEAKNEVDFIATNDGEGDFFYSISVDPALCAAIALDMDETLNYPDEDKILIDEQDVVIGQRADKAHLHFLKDHAYWERAYKLIVERLTTGAISIETLEGYTSSMYQWHNHLEGDKPSVIVRNSVNNGGHFVQFDLGPKIGVVKYRLECGYQPVDVERYWPVPDEPEFEDPDPEPDPKPEPKKPVGPQNTVRDDTPGKEDFGGGQNHDPDKTPTTQPVSPDSYSPPSQPEPAKPEPETEEPHHDGYDDLSDIQRQHDDDTVEQPLEDDGVNEGDFDESDVE